MQTRAEALEEPVREELAGHEGADTRPKRTRYSQSKKTRPCYPFNYENKKYTTHCNYEPRDKRQNIERRKHRKEGTEDGGYAPPPSAPSLRKSSQTKKKKDIPTSPILIKKYYIFMFIHIIGRTELQGLNNTLTR